MVAEEMEELRERLNKMLDSNEYSSSEILEVSQQLDILIVKYYREA